MSRFLDNLAKIIVIHTVLSIAFLIFLIVTVAFFGPVIAPLMNKLPW